MKLQLMLEAERHEHAHALGHHMLAASSIDFIDGRFIEYSFVSLASYQIHKTPKEEREDIRDLWVY